MNVMKPGLSRYLLLAGAIMLLFWGWSAWQKLRNTEPGASESAGAASPAFVHAAGAFTNGANGAFLALPAATAALAPRPSDVPPQTLDVPRLQARGQDSLLNPDLVRIFEQLLGYRLDDPENALAKSIPADKLPAAKRLFTQYQAYRAALAELSLDELAGKTPAEKLAEVVAARKVLQARYFTNEEIAGLFAADNRYDAFTVERLRIEADPQLSLSQRQQSVATLAEQLLTAEQQAARTAALLPARIHLQNGQQAATEAGQRFAKRQLELGQAAAVRMAEVDRLRADWQQRLAQLATAAPDAQAQLRLILFTPQEQRRLDGALELYRQQTSP